MTDNNLPQEGYIRLKTVLKFIPISKSTWWDGIKAGKYPKPVKLGRRITAWRVKDIKQYLNSPDT